MVAYLTSLTFVVLAEMGDKTQLLAMAFASRYRWQTVMWAVFAATLVNHLFAVLLGSYLTRIVPLQYVQIIAAASFILFGLWTLRGDKIDNEDRKYSYGPFWTVAVAFFFAEMGDKTQLATVALATKYKGIIQVWLGTTTGMIIADAIGIICGIVLCKNIPERLIKWFAALIFILFGLLGLYGSLPKHLLTLPAITGGIIVIGLLIWGINRLNNRQKNAIKEPLIPPSCPAGKTNDKDNNKATGV
jgi:Ca2+/H+ antiporter, TMEM165/GDT1 family